MLRTNGNEGTMMLAYDLLGQHYPISLVHNDEWHAHEGTMYEPEVAHAMARFVKPGDHVIDAGANLGLLSMLLSRLVGEQGEVLAFEPDVNNYAEFLRNVQLNQIKNIMGLPYALWSDQGLIPLNVMACGGYSSVMVTYQETLGTIHVLATTLDSVVKPGWDPVRLLKLDCEGAEEKIMWGGRDLLRRGVDCVICEINFHLLSYIDSTLQSIRGLMADLGYEFFVLKKDGSPPIYVAPDETVEWVSGPHKMINTMFSTREKVERAWK